LNWSFSKELLLIYIFFNKKIYLILILFAKINFCESIWENSNILQKISMHHHWWNKETSKRTSRKRILLFVFVVWRELKMPSTCFLKLYSHIYSVLLKSFKSMITQSIYLDYRMLFLLNDMILIREFYVQGNGPLLINVKH